MSTSIDYKQVEQETRSRLELTRRTYDDVRTEFGTWKRAHARDKLGFLRPPADSPDAPRKFPIPSKKFQIPPHCLTPAPSPVLETHSETGSCIQILNYHSDGTVTNSTDSIQVYNVVEPLEPHPEYRYCSPSSRNVNARMLDERLAAFHPFPEDPNFPAKKYLGLFGGFQWIDDQVDPDEEVIQFEVVRRLHIDHGLSPQDIDCILQLYGEQEDMSCLPLRDSHESGLLWAVSQRDLPEVIWHYGLPFSSNKQLPPHFVPKFLNPKDDFGMLNQADNCGVHVSHEWQQQTPPFHPKQPLLASTQLLAKAHEPCDNKCFLLLSEEALNNHIFDAVPVSQHTVLNSILKVEPDIQPCDLAVICEMTCSNAFLLRKQVLGDDVKPPSANVRKRNEISPQDPGSTHVQRTVPVIRRKNHVNETVGATVIVGGDFQDAIQAVAGTNLPAIQNASAGKQPVNATRKSAPHAMHVIINARTQVYSEEHLMFVL
ncbi:hypothetical protein R3P38DRAFT_3188503 [Favolaschia claudopus]|uniref:Uncharacterized protein n=1 Tax=Favolaschia claudopus TaxID=2862362 RepID=A0AAW0BVW8_9AGAR